MARNRYWIPVLATGIRNYERLSQDKKKPGNFGYFWPKKPQFLKLLNGRAEQRF